MGKNFPKKNKGKAKNFKKKFKKKLFVKQQQGDRRTVSFDNQQDYNRAKSPKAPAKDQNRRTFFKPKKGGDSGQQL
jgi:hypothetical protein